MPKKRVRSGKKSQRFREIAHIRWSKAAQPQDEPHDEPHNEPQGHVAAVTSVFSDSRIRNEAVESSVSIIRDETQGYVAAVTSISGDSCTRNEALESSASIISGCLTENDEHTVSDEQTTEDTVVDETDTVTTDSITDETQILVPESFQLGYGEVSVSSIVSVSGTVSVSSTDELIEDDSNDDCSSSDCSTSTDSSSEYFPTPLKRAKVNPVDLGDRVFMCQTTQLDDFLNQINTTSLCYKPNCVGKLVPISIKHIGLGGSLLVKFSCTGCSEWMLNLASSVEIEFSRRSACSLALQVAFIAAGCMYAQYSKVLKQHLGMSAVNSTTFYDC